MSSNPAVPSSGSEPAAAAAAADSTAGEPNDRRPESKPPEQPVPPGLVLVATPIGNAADISFRALRVLAGADLVACEDTRVTAKLFAVHGLRTPMLPYHEHNAPAQRPKLIKHLKKGETVALVSDAGMPLISDPGHKLVAACIELGIPLTCIPGPSAVPTALALSGLPSERFFFQGFLPSRKNQRRKVLASLGDVPGSLVFMESARRLAAMLGDAAETLGEREAAVTRELTKRFEEVRRDSLSALADHYARSGPPKGEVTVVVGPGGADGPAIGDADIDALLRGALEQGTVRDAAARVAAETGLSKRRVYQRALVLAKGRGGNP